MHVQHSNCRPHNSYTARLNRLKRGAGETLTLFGDESEEKLSPEEFGFADPSSYSDSGVGSENNNPWSANNRGGGGGGGLGVMEDGDGEEGDDDAVVPVGEGDDVLLVGGGEEGVEAQAAEAADTSTDVPVPHPINVEELEWDVKGDFVPLPAWKVCLHSTRGRVAT